MIKQELLRLGSQWPNGAPMYPGEWLFTWVKAVWGWQLLTIEPASQRVR